MNAKQTNKDKIYVTTVMLGWVCSAVAVCILTTEMLL